MGYSGLVLIHAGAGYHSLSKENLYKQLCDRSCYAAITLLKDGQSACKAAVAALQILEDSSLTNAGYGSSLTIEGQVECDASLMTSDGYFAAVAALQKVKNPILVPERLLQLQHTPPSDGRIPPSFLVGPGATDFAKEQGISLVESRVMVSESAQKNFIKYSKVVRKHGAKKRKVDSSNNDSDEPLNKSATINIESTGLDTVGVICMDMEGNIACALSSGGIALKHSGRVGQAALVGSGCWAESNIAVATTGCGEQLMRTLLAKTICQSLQNTLSDVHAADTLRHTMKTSFIDNPVLKKDPSKLAGAIVLYLDPLNPTVELMWTHTTKSMCVSYMTTESKCAETRITRLEQDKVSKESMTNSFGFVRQESTD